MNKQCSKCNTYKSLDNFYIRTDSNKPRNECILCIKLYHAVYRQKYKNKLKKQAKIYYENNHIEIKNRVSNRRNKLKDLINKKGREFYKNNKYKYIAHSSKKRAAKLSATPIWSNSKQILEFYEHAQLMQEITHNKYHVDHVHPLIHPLICGLHIPANLAVIEASKNLSKHNTFIPYSDSEGLLFNSNTRPQSIVKLINKL